MESPELERYLHRMIPLSHAMGVKVVSSDRDGVVLQAPLALNLNHHRTAFGGSISNLATLACWTQVYLLLRTQGTEGSLVIQRNEIEFLKPITGDFQAASGPVPPLEIERFFSLLQSRGKGRLAVSAVVRHEDQVCARFSGQFVAMRDLSQD